MNTNRNSGEQYYQFLMANLMMFEELREEISGIKDSLKSIEENYQHINDILNGSRFAASIFKGVVAFVLGIGAIVVGLSKFRQWF